MMQYGSGEAEVSVICPKTQGMIWLNRVEAGVQERICPEFRHQTDAAPFLIFINHEPPSFLCDGLHGDLELVPTVAAQRTKNLARKALRMDPQQRRAVGKIAHNERQGSFDSSNSVHSLSFESEGLKQAPTSRQACRDNLSN